IPGSDSAETCRRLASDSALGRVPVVVMATKGEDLEARFAKAPNVADYISKPFSPEALQAVVSHVVEAREAQQGKATGKGRGRGKEKTAAVSEALSRSKPVEAS